MRRHDRLERGHPAELHGHRRASTPTAAHFPTGTAYTLAARVKGRPADGAGQKAEAEEGQDEGSGQEKKAEAKPAEIHAIAIADLDLISEEFFELRRRKIENLELDNVTFVLNCVDVLAGDDAFVALRKRRLQHRTLERLEAQTQEFIDKRPGETKAAEDAAKEQLDVAQKQLDKEVEEVRGPQGHRRADQGDHAR